MKESYFGKCWISKGRRFTLIKILFKFFYYYYYYFNYYNYFFNYLYPDLNFMLIFYRFYLINVFLSMQKLLSFNFVTLKGSKIPTSLFY